MTLAVIGLLIRIRPYLGLASLGGKYEQAWVIENLSAYARSEEGSDVIDVGASESLLRLRLRKTRHRIYALDIRFLKGIDSKPFVLADAMRVPFRDEVFDFVVLGSAIEHVGLGVYGDPVKEDGDLLAMQEVRRVLRRGGYVVLTTGYSTVGGLTWERHYDDAMIERLTEGFVTVNKTYLISTGNLRRPWIRMRRDCLPQRVGLNEPSRAIICLLLQKL